MKPTRIFPVATPALVVVIAAYAGLFAGVRAAAAQDAGSKLGAVLERVSFDGAERPALLGKALADLEPSDLAKLCDMLVEPGTGDDTKPRMALHGLTWYVGSEGTPAQRTRFLKALCTALKADKPVAVKEFLIQQLQLAGDEQAVPTLAKLLRDEQLYDVAAQALLAIGGEAAKKAFREAYADAKGARRIAIIDAFGRLRDREGVSLLALDAASDERDVRWAVYSAMASVGELFKSLGVLEAFAADSWFAQCQSLALILHQFELSLIAEDPAQSALVADALRLRPEDPLHLQCAVLYTLAMTGGAKPVARIVEAMTSESLQLRAGATEIAVSLAGDGVMEALLGQLKEAEPALRATLLTVLERRGDSTALPAVLEALEDPEKDVRLAAAGAAAAIGQRAAVAPLVAFLDTDQDDEREAGQQALARIRGAAALTEIAGALEGAPPRVRIALLKVLTDRRARDQLDAICANTTHADEAVRIAAIRAIEVLADPRAAPKLLELLTTAKGEGEREAIEQALAATCNRADKPAARAAPILGALRPENVADYASLLRVLGHVGGAEALDAVRTALKDRRDEIREAAFKSLLDWPDPAAADDVLAIAKSAGELKHHVLALRAYARLVSLDQERPAEQMLAMYAAGLQATRRTDETKLLLGKLAEVHDGRTLPILMRFLDDAALRPEAAAAMVSVADGLLPKGWPEARAAAEMVLATVSVENVRERAEAVLKRVAEFEDFITDWQVAGPYTQPGKPGPELFETAFLPEQPDAKDVQWLRQPVSDDPGDYWRMDLQRTASIAGDDRAAYLRTRLHSPQAQPALFEVGSDDGIKIWLNGQVVHAKNVPRGCARDQDQVRVTLQEGWNDILIKIVNGGGAWAACLRVRAPDGSHLDGLRAAP